MGINRRDQQRRQEVQEVVKSDWVLEMLFEYINEKRKYNSSEMRIESLLKQLKSFSGKEIYRQQLIDSLRKLGSLKMGRFIKGSHGYSSRFEWAEPGMLECARLLIDTEEHELELAGDDLFYAEDSQFATYLHTFQLRHDYEFEIELPVDLTEDESNRIGQLISGLATGSTSDLADDLLYTFPLRQGVEFELELPRDLSDNEAYRLGLFINAIVIDTDDLELEEYDWEDLDDDE